VKNEKGKIKKREAKEAQSAKRKRKNGDRQPKTIGGVCDA